MKLPYNSGLTLRSRELRNQSTLSEVLLWNKLKARQMCNYQFMRQKPIENYIVDLFAGDLMLAIEIDGATHIGKEAYDRKRQNDIELLGIKFLRFNDGLVKSNMESVLRTIEAFIKEYELHHGPPIPRGRAARRNQSI